jgi:hypothetical protein
LGSKTFGRENIFVNLVQKIFDRFGVSADFIAKSLGGNFSAKNLKKIFSTEFNFW